MKFDPYGSLGVDRGATIEDIKGAYRRSAKRAHPDAGGSDEQFADVTRAYRLLTDRTRRERYDATGNADEATVDNSIQAAIGVIVGFFDQFMQGAVEGNQEIENLDLLDVAKKNIQMRQGQFLTAKSKALRHIDGLERVCKRSRRKRGAKGPDILSKAIKFRIIEIQRQIANTDREIKSHGDAIELLNGYEFDMERYAQISLMGGIFGSSTTTTWPSPR